MAPPTLETRDLTIRFGGHVAVDAVSCAFERGTLTAIVGPNGAGKTTYFNLISGQLKATAGTVWLDGQDISRAGVAERTRARHRPRVPAHQPVSQPHACARTCGWSPRPGRGAGSTSCPWPTRTPS